jgi:hypothetical protein
LICTVCICANPSLCTVDQPILTYGLSTYLRSRFAMFPVWPSCPLLSSVPSRTQRTSHQFWVLPVLAVSTNVVVNGICILSSSIGSRQEKKNVYMTPQATSPCPCPSHISSSRPKSMSIVASGCWASVPRHRWFFELTSTVLEECRSRVLSRCEFERSFVSGVLLVYRL